jgi:hypothetical protein
MAAARTFFWVLVWWWRTNGAWHVKSDTQIINMCINYA